MTYKRKTQPAEVVEQPAEIKREWKFEDGVTADSPPEIREQWLAEYVRRKNEVLPKNTPQEDLWRIENQ